VSGLSQAGDGGKGVGTVSREGKLHPFPDGRGRPSVYHRAAWDDDIAERAIAAAEEEIEGLPRMLTIPQVMKILQVSQSWCYHDRDQARVLPWVKIGRHVRLHPDDLKAFIDGQRSTTGQTIMRRDGGLTQPLELDLNDYK